MGGNNMSALFLPIRTGDTELLRQVLHRYGNAVPLLLQKQFIANADGCMEPDPVFTTPLKFCLYCNEPECLRILLEAGGDPNEGGAGGATLLHKACKKMSVECVKILLEYGARIYDCDEWGVYPIHVCAGAYGDFDDSLKILDILLNAGNFEDIHLKDGESQKLPLHYAAQYGNKKMCEKLLQLGVDINAKDKHGRTAYQNCERQKKVREFLEQQGCELPQPVQKRPNLTLFPVGRSSASKPEAPADIATNSNDATSVTPAVNGDGVTINTSQQNNQAQGEKESAADVDGTVQMLTTVNEP